jgi:flavin reductase (DIM6/NTAB) family NADH-FMN oxidoreductase RutF
MNIEWGSPEAHAFITNVGLITTDGPIGPNIMAAEWMHQISYSPGLIAVCVHNSNHATAENIRKSKEFGVGIASIKQSMASSMAGKTTGSKVDKIAVLKELGFGFEKAKKINVQMMKDTSLNLECKLVHEVKLGSHTMFVGEVIEKQLGKEEPLAFHAGKYWHLSETLPRPSDEQRAHFSEVIAHHPREAKA